MVPASHGKRNHYDNCWCVWCTASALATTPLHFGALWTANGAPGEESQPSFASCRSVWGRGLHTTGSITLQEAG